MKKAESVKTRPFETLMCGGEGEIRTLGSGLPDHSLSRRAPSASSVTSPFVFCGGGGRIRTHGASRLNGFQDRHFQPLSHSSEAEPRIYIISQQGASSLTAWANSAGHYLHSKLTCQMNHSVLILSNVNIHDILKCNLLSNPTFFQTVLCSVCIALQ